MIDRVRGWASSAATAILAVGFIGWRGVQTAPGAATALASSPALSNLEPFATPLSDTIVIRLDDEKPVSIRRDPFSAFPAPRLAIRQQATPRDTSSPSGARPAAWNVSATLMVGSKRAAIINDVLLGIGDSLPGGVTLTSVERDRVVLTDSKGTAHTVAVTEEEEEP